MSWDVFLLDKPAPCSMYSSSLILCADSSVLVCALYFTHQPFRSPPLSSPARLFVQILKLLVCLGVVYMVSWPERTNY